MRLCDAHNHLQDERFRNRREEIIASARSAGVSEMVVNGTREEDWDEVLALARKYPGLVVPSFGLHPWYVAGKSGEADWRRKLLACLSQVKSGVGEIGLDGWILSKKGRAKMETRNAGGGIPTIEEQEEVFTWQWRLAAEKNLPASVHCLQAWGRLLEILRAEPRPARGFVLHSFGGPAELIPELTKLGAYFSMPGYYALERKVKQREAFRKVPVDRLLIETDAPDQSLPPERVQYPLEGEAGEILNHPANLGAVYEFAAEVIGTSVERLTEKVALNFQMVFGGIG